MAWIGAGMADVAVAIGVDSLSTMLPTMLDMNDPFGPGMGLVLPALYAMHAQHYLETTGADPEHLARVAVKNRANAALNPMAHFQEAVTLEQVLGSKMICDPLTMLECCPNTDGAAAVILASESAAQRLGWRGGVKIVASAMASGAFIDNIDIDDRVTVRTSATAYRMAGITPDQVDLVELHDAFAVGELLYVEQLGLAPSGGAWKALAEGELDRTGRVAVNPGGGLIGRGHPMGPTGVAQLCEATIQLRGEAGPRQVPNARIALTHTLGGNQFDLEANACVVNVLTV